MKTINSVTMVATFFMVVLFAAVLVQPGHSSLELTREDCADLYSMVGGGGQRPPVDAMNILRRISREGLDADAIVRLYDLCLRSEEGIRYRRTGAPPLLMLTKAVASGGAATGRRPGKLLPTRVGRAD